MDSAVSRRPCFVEVSDGLASIADIEAGSSGNRRSFFSRSLCSTKRSSFRNLSSSSPRSVRFYDARFEPQPHFLHACSLCKKSLGDNRDIFMYRGDTPFCSEECRQEQIEIDEAKEKNWNLSSSMKALRKEQNKSTSPNTNQGYAFRTSTIAAA